MKQIPDSNKSNREANSEGFKFQLYCDPYYGPGPANDDPEVKRFERRAAAFIFLDFLSIIPACSRNPFVSYCGAAVFIVLMLVWISCLSKAWSAYYNAKVRLLWTLPTARMLSRPTMQTRKKRTTAFFLGVGACDFKQHQSECASNRKHEKLLRRSGQMDEQPDRAR